MANKAKECQCVESLAKARHEKIAEEKREANNELKKELSQMSSNAKHFEKECKDAIRELPREERPAAREKLREDMHKRREVEREIKKEIRKDEFSNSIFSRNKDRESHPETAVRMAESINESPAPSAAQYRDCMLETEIDDLKQKVLDNSRDAHSDIVEGEEAVLRAHRGESPDKDDDEVVGC